MISLEKALGDYTDLLNEKKEINLEDFKDELSTEDYKEFIELIEIIQFGKSLKITKEFDEMFSELNEYKENIYNNEQALNFRKSSNIKDDDIEEKINKILDKEFNEDYEI
jgi:hypothetical protein